MKRIHCDLCKRVTNVKESVYGITITKAGRTQQRIEDVCEECYGKIRINLAELCVESETEGRK